MFGLPVLSTRHQCLRARPSWKRAAGFVGAAMLLGIIGSAQEKAAAPAAPIGSAQEKAAAPAAPSSPRALSQAIATK